jgi:hypothetical protein
MCYNQIHCKKRLTIFPSPFGMSLTKLSLEGNKELFQARESLVNDIPAGDGKLANLFYSVEHSRLYIFFLLGSTDRTPFASEDLLAYVQQWTCPPEGREG